MSQSNLLEDLSAEDAPLCIARDLPHHEQLVGEFVGRDAAILEKRDECVERDGLPWLRRHRGEDAVAEQRIGQHEARRIEKSRKGLIEPVELARGNGEAAMMKELVISSETQAASNAIVVDLGAKSRGHEAVAIRQELASTGPLRYDRAAQQEISHASIRVLLAKPRLHEYGALAIVADLDRPERKGRVG